MVRENCQEEIAHGKSRMRKDMSNAFASGSCWAEVQTLVRDPGRRGRKKKMNKTWEGEAALGSGAYKKKYGG